MLKKMQLFALTVLLLVIADLTAVYGFFYFCIFNVPAGDETAHLGAEYTGAVVLSSCDRKQEYFRYLLVEMPSGETRVLALQEYHDFSGRYRFSPDDVLYVPAERPFTGKIHTATGSASICVAEDNSIQASNIVYNYLGSVENFTQLFLFALLAVEFALWLVIVRLRNGPVPTLSAKESPALQEAGMPSPALDRNSLRSGPGHPAQRIPVKSIFKPILFLLLLAVAGFGLIYFVFQTFIFTTAFDGSLASLGPEYDGAALLNPDPHFDPKIDYHAYLIRTRSGETQLLIIRPTLHPGRYQTDLISLPEERPYTFRYNGLGLSLPVEITADSRLSLLHGNSSSSPSGLSYLEFLLFFGWLIFIWALSVFISRRIQPPEDGGQSA